jgi:hypothetical protein
MALTESTFSKVEIKEFLHNSGNTYASKCWATDIKEERPSYTKTADWFKNYFPSNINQYMFRMAEWKCTQVFNDLKLNK